MRYYISMSRGNVFLRYRDKGCLCAGFFGICFVYFFLVGFNSYFFFELNCN